MFSGQLLGGNFASDIWTYNLLTNQWSQRSNPGWNPGSCDTSAIMEIGEHIVIVGQKDIYKINTTDLLASSVGSTTWTVYENTHSFLTANKGGIMRVMRDSILVIPHDETGNKLDYTMQNVW